MRLPIWVMVMLQPYAIEMAAKSMAASSAAFMVVVAGVESRGVIVT